MANHKAIKTILVGIAIGIIVAAAVQILFDVFTHIVAVIWPIAISVEGAITQDGEPVDAAKVVISGHQYTTRSDGKYIIPNVQVAKNMTFNVDLPPIPQIKYDRHYYLGVESENMFLRDVNDDLYKSSYIYFKLTEEEASNDLRLFLDTVSGTHDVDEKHIPYFKMKIRIRPLEGDWIYLEEKKFGSEEGAHDEQWINIKEPLIEPGENIIVFENANPVKSGYWVLWDSLRLEEVKGHRVWELGTNDGLPDEFWNPWQCKQD